MTTRDKIDEKKDELIELYDRFISAISITLVLHQGELSKEFNEERVPLKKELSALKSQLEKEPEMYPEEFVLWLHDIESKMDIWYDYAHDVLYNSGDTGWHTHKNEKISFPQLLTHWKDNIKDK